MTRPIMPKCVVYRRQYDRAGRMAGRDRTYPGRDTVIYELHVGGITKLRADLPRYLCAEPSWVWQPPQS